MKVVAFNGSARREGNTSILIKAVFAELQKEGIETELVNLSGKPLRGCMACYGCFQNKNKRCVVEDDLVNDAIAKMIAADGIILASPVYVADVSSEMKALIDRACLVSKANGDIFSRKVGAAVAAVRRGGAIHAVDTMNHFFGISQMYTVGSCYWNFAFGREIGEVLKDEEGMRTMKVLGENMAWAIKKMHS
ncbi:MAG: flavodoxin family protein [Candidatus Omnitrophica bacterium]|nr:flavodoxin family protein [Candidatus Omnitrophota bacterium]